MEVVAGHRVVVAFAILAAACAAPVTPPSRSADPARPRPAASEPKGGAASAPASPDATSRRPEHVEISDAPGDGRLDAAAALARSKQHARAQVAVENVLAELDASGSTEGKMAARVLLARACKHLGDARCARTRYVEVRALWERDQARPDRTAREVNAVCEALFFAAEEKRAAAAEQRFPAYRGSGADEDIRDHMRKEVGAWQASRRAAAEDAQNAYAAILQLSPPAPARWAVAAAASTAAMWGRLAAEHRAAPIPAAWNGKGQTPTGLNKEEMRRRYYASVDAAAAPLVATARAAYERCQDVARSVDYSDEASRRCDTWIAKQATGGSPLAVRGRERK